MRNPYEVLADKEKQVKEKAVLADQLFKDISQLRAEVDSIHVVLPLLHEPSDVFGLPTGTHAVDLSSTLIIPVPLSGNTATGWEATTKRWP